MDLKAQSFLCGFAFRPHVSDEYEYRKRNLSKTLSKMETFENANPAYTCRRGKRNLRERWRHGSCPTNMAPDRRIRVDEALVYFSRAFGKSCSVYLFRFLYVQAEHVRIKLNISKLFSMRVSRIRTDSFREARDRSKIDEFGFVLPGQALGGTISQNRFLPEKYACFFHIYLQCVHTLLQPITHGSPVCGHVWTGKCYAATCRRWKTERKVCVFQFIRIRVDGALYNQGSRLSRLV